ncbi:MAG TPA: Rieske (2Fe-2S) protein [Thermoleophilaceae bacterium]|jgi:nitrite reductase/ring-hydroxylating ferredoxin subunit
MSVSTSEVQRTVVCESDELSPGEMVAATVGSLHIVVVRARDGSLHALEDRCLHQGARLSRGRLLDAIDGERPGDYRVAPDSELVKCPWHGYEYDVRTGCALFDRRRRLRRARVYEDDGQIVAER